MRYLRGKDKTALSEIREKLPKNLLFKYFRGLSKPHYSWASGRVDGTDGNTPINFEQRLVSTCHEIW